MRILFISPWLAELSSPNTITTAIVAIHILFRAPLEVFSAEEEIPLNDSMPKCVFLSHSMPFLATSHSAAYHLSLLKCFGVGWREKKLCKYPE
jgi:hypothetical protein